MCALKRIVGLLGVVFLVLGCAPVEDETTVDDADAVKVREVVERGSAKLLEGYAASEDAQRLLGIQSWSVYAGYDWKLRVVATVAYGVGDDGHIRYSVVVAVTGGDAERRQAKVAVVRFDEAGPADDQTIPDADRAVLGAETERLGHALEERKSLNLTSCMTGLATAFGTAALVVGIHGYVTGPALVGGAITEMVIMVGGMIGITAAAAFGAKQAYVWQRALEGKELAVNLVVGIATSTARSCVEAFARR